MLNTFSSIKKKLPITLLWSGMIGYVLLMCIEFAIMLFILLTAVAMIAAVLWYAMTF